MRGALLEVVQYYATVRGHMRAIRLYRARMTR